MLGARRSWRIGGVTLVHPREHDRALQRFVINGQGNLDQFLSQNKQRNSYMTASLLFHIIREEPTGGIVKGNLGTLKLFYRGL